MSIDIWQGPKYISTICKKLSEYQVDQLLTYWKKRTEDPREDPRTEDSTEDPINKDPDSLTEKPRKDPITEDPNEDPITVDPKENSIIRKKSKENLQN